MGGEGTLTSKIQYFYNTDSSIPQCKWQGASGYISKQLYHQIANVTVTNSTLTGLKVNTEQYLILENVRIARQVCFNGGSTLKIMVGTTQGGSDIKTWTYTSSTTTNLSLDISAYKGKTIYITLYANINLPYDDNECSGSITLGNTYITI